MVRTQPLPYAPALLDTRGRLMRGPTCFVSCALEPASCLSDAVGWVEGNRARRATRTACLEETCLRERVT